MNRNKKEKYARIEIRLKPKEKEKIKSIAAKCNLSVSESSSTTATLLLNLMHEKRYITLRKIYRLVHTISALCHNLGTLPITARLSNSLWLTI